MQSSFYSNYILICIHITNHIYCIKCAESAEFIRKLYATLIKITQTPHINIGYATYILQKYKVTMTKHKVTMTNT